MSQRSIVKKERIITDDGLEEDVPVFTKLVDTKKSVEFTISEGDVITLQENDQWEIESVE